jgi:hypothetical protein
MAIPNRVAGPPRLVVINFTPSTPACARSPTFPRDQGPAEDLAIGSTGIASPTRCLPGRGQDRYADQGPCLGESIVAPDRGETLLEAD